MMNIEIWKCIDWAMEFMSLTKRQPHFKKRIKLVSFELTESCCDAAKATVNEFREIGVRKQAARPLRWTALTDESLKARGLCKGWNFRQWGRLLKWVWISLGFNTETESKVKLMEAIWLKRDWLKLKWGEGYENLVKEGVGIKSKYINNGNGRKGLWYIKLKVETTLGCCLENAEQVWNSLWVTCSWCSFFKCNNKNKINLYDIEFFQ